VNKYIYIICSAKRADNKCYAAKIFIYYLFIYFQEYQNCDTSLLTGLDAFAFGYQVETFMVKMF
jgi:hypothetical protein